MNLKRVIYVCNFAANYGGNFLSSLYNVAKKLSEKQVEVSFVFPDNAIDKNWEVNLEQFNVKYVDFNNSVFFLNTVKKLVTDNCIIHTHFLNEKSFLKLGLGINKFGFKNVNFVYHEHMVPSIKLKYKIIGYSGDIILRNSYYIGVSPAVKKELEKLHFNNRTFLLTNGIDIKRLNFEENKTHKNNNILIFASAYYRKGTDLAVEAINSCWLRDKVQLILVTHNPVEARSILEKHYGLVPKFVKIVPPYKNIALLYQNSFLFLSPSRSEAFGYANLESAYSGNQVIVSNIPGQSTLKNVPYITWISKNSVSELQKAIMDAYKNKDSDSIKQQKLENNKFITANYSLDNWTIKLLEIYKKISNIKN